MDADVTHSKGVYVGDGIQVNLFAGRDAPRGPVVAGNVPQAPPAFQSRDNLMNQLRAAGPGVSVVRAVTGMRGVGKTQLAAAYARECINAGWRLVAWVNAEDTATILQGLAIVADRLGISRTGTLPELVAEEVRNRLEVDGSRCLLVFDNVTDPNWVRPYTPSAGESQVVVTSTQASTVTLGRSTRIGVFTEDESVAFLAERTGIDDLEGARALANEVGHLPLALAQAAALIQAQRLTYHVYMERLRSYSTHRYLPLAEGDQYPRGVAEAIGLSVDTVTATGQAGLCATILAVVSLLSPEGISRQFLYGGHPGPSGPLGGGPEEIDAALGQLVNASLLSFSRIDGSDVLVTAHRLVMRVVRERLVRDGLLDRTLDVVFDTFSAANEPLTELSWDRPAVRELGRHVTSLDRHAHGLAGLTTHQLMFVVNWQGWHELRQKKKIDHQNSEVYRLKGELHRVQLRLRSAGLPVKKAVDPDVSLREYNDDKRRWNDDLVETTTRLQEAYSINTRLAHPGTVLGRNNLALANLMAGHADTAISLYRASLGDLMQHLGDEHPLTLIARNDRKYSEVQ